MEPQATPIRLWRARKGAREITCDLVRYEHGIDLRAWSDGELHRTQLCRDGRELTFVQADWLAKLEADGWALVREGSRQDGGPADG